MNTKIKNMMKHSFNSLAMMLLLSVSATSFAEETVAVGDPESAIMLEMLKTKYQSTSFKSVKKTPIKDIYEVVLGNYVAFTDKTGKYFLFGKLFDMEKQEDLTTSVQPEEAKVNFKDLPLDKAMKTVKGTGSRKLVIFSDPDCPYCRQLERNLTALNDVTIYTFLYPLEGLHPGAREKAVSVWCAKDQNTAWRNMMIAEQEPTKLECKNPVDEIIKLGESLGISGTPTLISEDGRVMPGAASAARIDAWLGKK